MREILVSDAVVCPWTVVVHPQDALPASLAVVGSFWLVSVALYAVFSPHCLRLFELLYRQLERGWRRPRRHCYGEIVREPEHGVCQLEVDKRGRAEGPISKHDVGRGRLQIQDQHRRNGDSDPGAAEFDGHGGCC